MPANNRKKFCIRSLKGRLVKFETLQVEGKLTSLRVSKGNISFSPELPLGKFWGILSASAPTPGAVVINTKQLRSINR